MTPKKPAPAGPTEYEIALEQFAAEFQPSEPEAPSDGPCLEDFLGWVIQGGADKGLVGERVLLLSFMFPLTPNRPATCRELGKRLGVSHTAARRKVSTLQAYFIGQRGKFRTSAFQAEP